MFEAGTSAGAAIQQWGHVRLFSPWKYLVDIEAQALLRETSWTMPDPEGYPTGQQFLDAYLTPLAQTRQLAPCIHWNTRVLAVTRQGYDKMKTAGREQAPLLVRVQTADGREEDILARAIIDASGTYGQPNPLGASGTHARGEKALAEHLFYGIPHILGQHWNRFAGRRVLVVGSGHSAFNALLDLATLAEQESATTIQWAIRRPHIHQLFGGGEQDGLPARGQLGMRIQQLVQQGRVALVTGVQIEALHATDAGMVVAGEDRLTPVDEIIVTTGFRPDLSLLQELRLGLDPITESPVALAPLIDPNVHSCGTVPPHGIDELSHPEPNVYIVGMKSYGRAPTFLMLTGYEQVRSITCALTGDWERARTVQLELPETGVCSTDFGGSCCQTAPDAKESVHAATSTACCSPAAPALITIGGTRKTEGTCCGE
nr:NAD(P)-binding domain-containing protein [Dictyobacter formicarum]